MKIKKSKLEGEVTVSGAKNSVLRLLAASLLTDEDIILDNYPSKLLDAQIHVQMLNILGKKCILKDDDTLIIKKETETISELNWNERSIRNTLLILGALTAKTGVGKVPLPGGCNLGERAYDIHEMILRQLGATVWEENNMLCAEAPQEGLIGTDIHLPIRSTGATENAIIMGTLANGTTRVWNPHIRPEIIELTKFLNKMGADIEIYGQEHIKIEGKPGLKGIRYRVMPDNMEAITWLIASVITNGNILIKNFPYNDLEVAMIHLKNSGAKFYRSNTELIVTGGCSYPLEISTGPHPGINSDVQPLFAAYAACAKGESRIVDLRFIGRYDYAQEMKKMGISSTVEGNMLKIFGNDKIIGSHVQALDLRAGASLALLGLVAEGETIIEDAWQIERGYNNFVKKLKQLNGKIEY